MCVHFLVDLDLEFGKQAMYVLNMKYISRFGVIPICICYVSCIMFDYLFSYCHFEEEESLFQTVPGLSKHNIRKPNSDRQIYLRRTCLYLDEAKIPPFRAPKHDRATRIGSTDEMLLKILSAKL